MLQESACENKMSMFQMFPQTSRSLLVALSALILEFCIMHVQRCCDDQNFGSMTVTLACPVAFVSFFLVVDMCCLTLQYFFNTCGLDMYGIVNKVWHSIAIMYVLGDCLTRAILNLAIQEILFPLPMFMASIVGVKSRIIIATVVIALISVVLCHWLQRAGENVRFLNTWAPQMYMVFVTISFILQALSLGCTGMLTYCENWNRSCAFKNEAQLRAMRARTTSCKNSTMQSNVTLANGSPNIILFVVDSVPATSVTKSQESVTSFDFLQKVEHYFETCHYLQHHHAASSYTNDAFFSMLHSIVPLGNEYIQKSVPLTMLSSAGYTTSAFLNGAIGADYCKVQLRDQNDGMRYLNHLQIVDHDSKVEEDSRRWITEQKKKFFSIVYFEGTHLLEGQGTNFENEFLEIMSRIDRIVGSVSGDLLYFVTSDHGCLQKGGIVDCPTCFGHGYGVHGFHANKAISHVPMWICRRSNSSISPEYIELIESADKIERTSAMDLLPTILDYLGLLHQDTLQLFSGISWMQHQPLRQLFSYTRLKCEFSYGVIDNDTSEFYLDVKTNDTGCLLLDAIAIHNSFAQLDSCLKVRVPQTRVEGLTLSKRRETLHFLVEHIIKPYRSRAALTWTGPFSYQICNRNP